MTDPVKHFLTDAELARVDACVRAAEAASRGEIVVMVAPASHHYPMAGLLGAAALSVPAAIALARAIGPIVWAGPHDLWIFLGCVFPLFFLCRALVTRLPRLKRVFVPAAEMDHEVREAAALNFLAKDLHRTREQNGVLIYLSVFEGRVWILGDRGVDAVAPAGFWQEVVGQVTAGIRTGRRADAICVAVERVRDLLAANFPALPGDTNELPDVILAGQSTRTPGTPDRR
jgi:putative membrane protein